MAEINQDAKSVGQAKSLPFGAVLRKAIKREFGTGKEFAAKSGVSEGRVSQLLSGTESLTAQTLEDILRSFSNLGDQERLHSAWVSTFAPSPLQGLEIREAQDSAYRLLQTRECLAAEGQAKESMKALQALKARVKDVELTFGILSASIELSLFLGRSEQARQFCATLIREATDKGEMAWIAQALWLTANVARAAPESSSARLAQSHDAARDFVSAWKPSSLEGRQKAIELRRTLIRDRALTLLALNERKPVPEPQLAKIAEDLERQLAASDFRSETVAVFLEVKGRVLLSQGETIATEEVIEEASQIRAFVSPDHDIKSAILSGQLLLARGLPEKARAVLLDALDACYEVDNLHHARSIERILSRSNQQTPSNG